MQWQLLFVSLIAVAGSRAAVAGSAEENLYRKAIGNIIRTSFEAAGTVEGTQGRKLALVLRHTLRDGRRTVIEVTAPAEFRGQRWLIVDEDGAADKIWHFDAKTKRTREVPEEQWNAPWLGTDFTLSDFLLPDPGAYTYELGGDENIGGETFTVIRLAPKDKEKDRFAVRVYSVDPRGGRLVRALFFDQQGRAVRRWIAERTEQRSGEWFPAQQRVVDLTTQKSSLLTLSEFRYEPKLAADAFDAKGLAAEPTPAPK
ncbi:MAG: outer membrane lipoprotein-sorting protein [Candidatus Binatia bacterium]|nr:outer membrane lipoprotein-sorting protein [Candidatus Binatia bacterium]